MNERRFTGTPSTPEECIVGGRRCQKLPGIGNQCGFLIVHVQQISQPDRIQICVRDKPTTEMIAVPDSGRRVRPVNVASHRQEIQQPTNQLPARVGEAIEIVIQQGSQMSRKR